ncbi:site-specific integrase [Vibrio europaeus]|uniref:site-specific integrase n=1 Tax=Vibrio europaeus TaxID=300876 RepID=UPI00233F1794|nr:site-specific integrase [Vibrio europaeus]MDC5870256.1 site-specific integrase [Vibrio europaeus]
MSKRNRRNGKDLGKQAEAVIKSKIAVRGSNSIDTKNPGRYKELQSIRSINDTSDALAKIAKDLGVKRIKHITPKMAEDYLKTRRDNYASQKSLDRERKALSIALNTEFKRTTAIKETEMKSRSYTTGQVKTVCDHMSERNALAAEIAYRSGLRAHELITITRSNEGSVTESRTWSDERFASRTGEVYLVTGKGGLTREVLLPRDLAARLEERRLDAPVLRRDRKVNYAQYYDIGGGQALSQSWSDASKRALGFSNGLHGVRHSYAQERLDEVKYHYKADHERARDIVAEELGHFRGIITEVYLR